MFPIFFVPKDSSSSDDDVPLARLAGQIYERGSAQAGGTDSPVASSSLPTDPRPDAATYSTPIGVSGIPSGPAAINTDNVGPSSSVHLLDAHTVASVPASRDMNEKVRSSRTSARRFGRVRRPAAVMSTGTLIKKSHRVSIKKAILRSYKAIAINASARS